MCLICVDFDRGALKLAEARRALGEMRAKIGPDHARQVEEKLEAAKEPPLPPPTASKPVTP